jgi:transposase
MNYFDYPFTNGTVKGQSGRAKRLKRIGAGYSIEMLELKLRSDGSCRTALHLPH